MARRQRKRRLRRQSNETRRGKIAYQQAFSLYGKTLGRQKTVRIQYRTNRRKIARILQGNPQNQIRGQTKTRRTLIGLVGKVMSSLPTTNTQNSLQARPSIQSRKEHKCIRKPNSKTAGSGSGKYKGQWKPWCL